MTETIMTSSTLKILSSQNAWLRKSLSSARYSNCAHTQVQTEGADMLTIVHLTLSDPVMAQEYYYLKSFKHGKK